MGQSGRQELLEHYYAKLEKDNTFHCNERNDSEACHKLGVFLQKTKKRYTEAIEVFKKNCYQREYGDSCFEYGQMHAHGIGVEKDNVEAYKAHEKGCSVKKYNGASCETIGKLLITDDIDPVLKDVRGNRDVEQGVKLHVKGCEAKDGIACLRAALAYKDGIKGFISQDLEVTFKYAMKACDYKAPHGCQIVADAYKSGIGVPQNEERYLHFQKMFDLMTGVGKTGPIKGSGRRAALK